MNRLKKTLNNAYFGTMGFVLGILLIVRCGGSSNSLAQEIAAALGISYADSSSVLAATNVQDAINELVNTLPILKDANGRIVGLIAPPEHSSFSTVVWNKDAKAWLEVDTITGEPYEDGDITEFDQLYYVSPNCEGQPYLFVYRSEQRLALRIGENYYQPSLLSYYSLDSGNTEVNRGNMMLSRKFRDGNCTNFDSSTGSYHNAFTASGDTDYTFVEAEEITNMPTFVGPLTYVGQ